MSNNESKRRVRPMSLVGDASLPVSENKKNKSEKSSQYLSDDNNETRSGSQINNNTEDVADEIQGGNLDGNDNDYEVVEDENGVNETQSYY